MDGFLTIFFGFLPIKAGRDGGNYAGNDAADNERYEFLKRPSEQRPIMR